MSQSEATISMLSRPLPNFARWLDERGHSARGDAFDALVDLCERTQQQTADPLSPSELSFCRMWQGLLFAVVELCNIEHEHGRTPEQIIQTMPRVAAAAAFYATASICAEDTPWRSIAKVLTEEFRFGAKSCADQMTERAERETK